MCYSHVIFAMLLRKRAVDQINELATHPYRNENVADLKPQYYRYDIGVEVLGSNCT